MAKPRVESKTAGFAPARKTHIASLLPARPQSAISTPPAPQDRSPAAVPLDQGDVLLQEVVRGLGTRHKPLAIRWLTQAAGTLPHAQADAARQELVKTVLPALPGIAPRDPVEGMLALQMVVLMPSRRGSLRRITVTAIDPPLSALAVQLMLEAGALREEVLPRDGCVGVLNLSRAAWARVTA